jgi:hypothetical protein
MSEPGASTINLRAMCDVWRVTCDV